MKRSILKALGVVLSAGLLWVSGASAQVEWVAEIQEGSNEYPGTSSIPYEGSPTPAITVSSWDYTTTRPFDPGSGGGSGTPKIVEGAVNLNTGAIARRIPFAVQIFNAQYRSRILQVVLKAYVPDNNPSGRRLVYKVTLNDAQLISTEWSASADIGASANLTQELTLAFYFRSIVLRDEENGQQVTRYWGDAQPPSAAKGPTTLALLPPHPNPSRGTTNLSFRLPVSSPAQLAIYDLRGRLVVELYDGISESSGTVVEWDGRNAEGATVARGVYTARLSWPEGVVTRSISMVE